MATTYTLKFTKFKTLDDWNGLTDVIRLVHWRMVAETDDATPIVKTAYGAATLPFPDPPSFVPRTSVDVATMQGWFDSLDDDEGRPLIATTKAMLDAQIEKERNPASHDEIPDTGFTTGVTV